MHGLADFPSKNISWIAKKRLRPSSKARSQVIKLPWTGAEPLHNSRPPTEASQMQTISLRKMKLKRSLPWTILLKIRWCFSHMRCILDFSLDKRHLALFQSPDGLYECHHFVYRYNELLHHSPSKSTNNISVHFQVPNYFYRIKPPSRGLPELRITAIFGFGYTS